MELISNNLLEVFCYEKNDLPPSFYFTNVIGMYN
jgi:hypothetical protein